MGWLDVFCCRQQSSDNHETERLTAPRPRGPSVTSQNGYGTMSMSARVPVSAPDSAKRSTPFSSEQRERMAAISKQAGSHMKSVGAYVAGRPTLPQPSFSRESSCSRSSSPSPPRPDTSPPSGALGDVEEVVHKSIFESNGQEGSSRRSSGSSGKRRRSRRVSRASR